MILIPHLPLQPNAGPGLSSSFSMAPRRRGLRVAAQPPLGSSGAPLAGTVPRGRRKSAEELRRVLFAPVTGGIPPDLEAEAVGTPKEEPVRDSSGESEEEYADQRPAEKERRRLGRSVRYWRPAPAGGELRLSVLEENAVTPAVTQQYRVLVEEFLDYSERQGHPLEEIPQVDAALVAMVTEMFFSGRDLAVASKLVAGWSHFFPWRGRSEQLPRCHRALKGWRRIAPPRSRVGVAFFVVAGIAAELLRRGFLSMAIWVLVGHGGYLRPSSNMRLRRGSFVRPTPGISSHWGLILHESDYGDKSKTGTQDDSLMWDVAELSWMTPVFEVLADGPPSERVWKFTYPQVAARVKEAASSLGLSFVPYQLRHSGPSWDRARNLRSLLEIQKRGLWRSTASVQRYEKATRMMAGYQKLNPQLRSHLELVTQGLPDYVLKGKPVPEFASSPSGSRRRGRNLQPAPKTEPARKRRLG